MPAVKNYGIDVTLAYDSPNAPRPGAVHVRVLSAYEDWSGWFDTEDEAFAAGRARRQEMRERIGDTPSEVPGLRRW